jgi:hypothetical protein
MTMYWGASRIATQLGVATGTVAKWIDRFSTTSEPFPAPDVEIVETDGRITRGWSPQRWPEIERWATTDRYYTRYPGRPRWSRTATSRDALPESSGA